MEVESLVKPSELIAHTENPTRLPKLRLFIKNYKNRNKSINLDELNWDDSPGSKIVRKYNPQYQDNTDFYNYILYILYVIGSQANDIRCFELTDCIRNCRITGDEIKEKNNLTAMQVLTHIRMKTDPFIIQQSSSMILEFHNNYDNNITCNRGGLDIIKFEAFKTFNNLNIALLNECKVLLDKSIAENTGRFFGHHFGRFFTGKRKGLKNRFKLIGGTRRKKRKNIRTRRK